MRVRLVADDLTGALDAGAQFTRCTPDFPVFFASDPASVVLEPNVSAAISTQSRERDPAAAACLATAAASFLANTDIAFMKIDSLLRGNWPIELRQLLDVFPEHTCIFAPAFPAERRLTHHGLQMAPDWEGRMSPLPLVPRAELARVGLRAELLPVGAAVCPNPGGVFICDALTDADLQVLVAAAGSIAAPILWCGSAGLARALSGRSARRAHLGGAAPLVIVGSNHSVTRQQLAALPTWAAAKVSLNGNLAQAIEGVHRYRTMPRIVSIEISATASRSAASLVIAQRLDATLPHLPPPMSLVVIGGETLFAVCRAVQAKALRLEGEWLPGAPCSRIIGGYWHDVPLMSRSGAFGQPDFFGKLLGLEAPGPSTR